MSIFFVIVLFRLLNGFNFGGTGQNGLSILYKLFIHLPGYVVHGEDEGGTFD